MLRPRERVVPRTVSPPLHVGVWFVQPYEEVRMRAAIVVAALLGLFGASSLAAAPAWAIVTPGTPIAVGTSPVGVTFNPAGTLGYVTISSTDQVAVVDAATGTLLTPITVGSGPMGIAFVPDGTRAYVANRNDDSVTVIDPVTRATLATIAVGDAPFFIAMSPDGSKAYVANSASASVSVIATATNTVSATITVGTSPVAVAFNPAGTRAYVANGTNVLNGNRVTVIDVATSTVVTNVLISGVPYGLAVSPDGTEVYVSRVNGLKISVIDTATNAVTYMFNLTAKPEGVTFSPDGTRVYVPTQTGGVIVIDAATHTLLTPLPSGSGSRIMAFTPDGALAYVTNNLSGTVSVFRFDNTLPAISGTPGAATVATPYTFTPTVTGTAVTVTVFTGPLPPGLSLVAGSITGTPTNPGNYPVTLRATNGNGSTDLTVVFTVAPPPLPTITGASTTNAPFGDTFTWTPVITGVAGYSVTGTALPAGLVLTASTGAISGTPSGVLGPTLVTLTVTDANGTATFPVTISVVHGSARTLTITPSDASPDEGDTITLTVIAADSGGNTWDVSGTAVVTSDVATDIVMGNQVTFPHASPHRLTVVLGGATASVLLQVRAASGILGLTGGSVPMWLPLSAIIATLLGIGLAASGRRARPRDPARS